MKKNIFFLIALLNAALTYPANPQDVSFEKMLQSASPTYWLPEQLVAQDASLDHVAIEACNVTRSAQKKAWTFIVYIAADNDLRTFASRNIRQMAAIGSNRNINIVAHLDIRINNNYKVTRRYYIEKNKVNHVNAHDPQTQQMDSGDENTLISCCKWAVENYPADHYALILWNHGTGILDPERGRVINPSLLFEYNPQTGLFDLDRSVDFLEAMSDDERGICWDDTTGNYLTNQKLEIALDHVCTNFLDGKKIDVIGFDACLMSMIEVASSLKKYASFMVSSQEVELGTGWNYTKALSQFLNEAPSPEGLCNQIVAAYKQSYKDVTNDYTLSSVNLEALAALEQNVDYVARILLECVKAQKHNSVKNAIKASRNKLLCTHFDESSYIDLHHFYENLESNIQHFALNKNETLKNDLKQKLIEGKQLIADCVMANVVGQKLKRAKGLSIYFPERKIHSSYFKTSFARSNDWPVLLKDYLYK